MSSKADRSEKRFTKAEKSWIMYDWANSIYATNIMAAIFPIYFAMQANETGNKLYGFAVSAAALVVAVLAPILGAIGDFSGMKKKLFAVSNTPRMSWYALTGTAMSTTRMKSCCRTSA